MPKIITRFTAINKESLTTKLTLIIIGLTAGSALLIPATYASFHPVTTGEIEDGTIQSRDISNTLGVASVDIRDGQVGSADIGDRQVAARDIVDNAIRPNIQIIEKQGTIPAASIGADISVDCPGGMVVTGGGFQTTYQSGGAITILNSYPVDSDTWRAHAKNSANSDVVIRVWAVCIGPMP
jgi:hypothetical protein